MSGRRSQHRTLHDTIHVQGTGLVGRKPTRVHPLLTDRLEHSRAPLYPLGRWLLCLNVKSRLSRRTSTTTACSGRSTGHEWKRIRDDNRALLELTHELQLQLRHNARHSIHQHHIRIRQGGFPKASEVKRLGILAVTPPVSYTHLTLPTILRV